MHQRSKGFSTRYDQDLGGNHIDALRKQAPQLGVFLDYAHRWCSCCGKKKPTKGGTRPGKGWACADCKTKTTATPNAPHTWRPIGHERVTDDGYRQRKVADTGVSRRDYINVHWLLWREAGREIPPGHALIFKDGDPTNIELDNLELISRADLMRRNSLHNYPKPIAELIQLRGALMRKIHRAERHHQETTAP